MPPLELGPRIFFHTISHVGSNGFIFCRMLMNLIGKDRQLEALVEKLCHRLRGASDERHCTDLSYCLTLVPYTDRTIQKLVDNIACFADKLNCAKLHKHFANIVIACKKQAKMNKVSRFSRRFNIACSPITQDRSWKC